MSDPYRPAFPEDDDYIKAKPGDLLVTIWDMTTAPFPKGSLSRSDRAWSMWERHMNRWLADEGSRALALLHSPDRFEPSNLSPQ